MQVILDIASWALILAGSFFTVVGPSVSCACALLPLKQLQAAVSCRRAAERLACAC